MIIRKQFKFEGAHIVRNCSSERCRKSIHGHSYIVEVFLHSSFLDRGGMVVDFGLLKGTIGDIVDSFDHTYTMWSKESDEFKDFMKTNSDRWIELPVSPSAENFAVVIGYLIQKVLQNTDFKNGEHRVALKAVRVHETATGYAEADLEDINKLSQFGLCDISFSDEIRKEWKNPHMILDILDGKKFQNPRVEVTHE